MFHLTIYRLGQEPRTVGPFSASDTWEEVDRCTNSGLWVIGSFESEVATTLESTDGFELRVYHADAQAVKDSGVDLGDKSHDATYAEFAI